MWPVHRSQYDIRCFLLACMTNWEGVVTRSDYCLLFLQRYEGASSIINDLIFYTKITSIVEC